MGKSEDTEVTGAFIKIVGMKEHGNSVRLCVCACCLMGGGKQWEPQD